MERTRRDVLRAGAGAAVLAGSAGCLDLFDFGDADGYVALYPIQAWTEAVAGDELDFENPVGTGRMGHGWSPDGDITPDIASTDIFIYVDTPEFSWAQNIVETLEADHGDDVLVVDAFDGLEPYLLPFGGGDGETDATMPDPDHDESFSVETVQQAAVDFEIWDRGTNTQLGYWHDTPADPGHWHGELPEVPVDSFLPVGIVVEDSEGRIVPLGPDEQYRVEVSGPDGSPANVAVESRAGGVRIYGESTGTTELVFEFYHGDERIYGTADSPMTVDVVEDAEHGEFFDPHAWTDPVLVQEMVDTVADGLVAIDEGNEDRYRENAAAYQEELAAVHQSLRETIDEAALDVAVFAGHDSFQYLESRYDFELQTPTGVTPDADVGFSDVEDLVDVIDAEGIDTVLYDPFEAPDPGNSLPNMVETLTDASSADNAEPLSPLEGQTEEWADNDWGWIEQMTEVNIPALDRALNPA